MSEHPDFRFRARRLQTERLRARFPGADIYHPSLTDKDQDFLTSDRRSHLDQRTFFLGEVFRSCYDVAGTMGPALVTRRESRAHAPLELAPVAHHRPGNDDDPWVFVPEVRGERLAEDTVFLLYFRRPVPREDVGNHLDTLDGWDKQRLSDQLARLRRSLD